MHTCIFAMNRNCAASDRPLRRPIQGHREERPSYENPDKRQGGNSLIGPRVKPANFECEPATGTITQRTTPSK